MRSRHLLPNFRIAIVGAGAIGLYYGGKLAHFGRDVHFLLRTDYETVRKKGLRIRSKTENIHVAKVNAYSVDGGDRTVRSRHRGGENDFQPRFAAAPRAIVRREDDDPDSAERTRE